MFSYPSSEVMEPRVITLSDQLLASCVDLSSDRIADGIRKKLGLVASQLTRAQVLESATWKGGREIAKSKRPQTGGPPIDIESDGTVF